MQVCTSLQTDNYASTPPPSFLQAGCPSCRPTNSVKALKANLLQQLQQKMHSPQCRLYLNPKLSFWQRNFRNYALVLSAADISSYLCETHIMNVAHYVQTTMQHLQLSNVHNHLSHTWHFTNKSVTGSPYSMKSYSLSHSQTLWWRVRWLKHAVPSWGRGGTAAAMAQNEQTTEEHSTLEQQSPGSLDHPACCVVWTVWPAST